MRPTSQLLSLVALLAFAPGSAWADDTTSDAKTLSVFGTPVSFKFSPNEGSKVPLKTVDLGEVDVPTSEWKVGQDFDWYVVPGVSAPVAAGAGGSVELQGFYRPVGDAPFERWRVGPADLWVWGSTFEGCAKGGGSLLAIGEGTAATLKALFDFQPSTLDRLEIVRTHPKSGETIWELREFQARAATFHSEALTPAEDAEPGVTLDVIILEYDACTPTKGQ